MDAGSFQLAGEKPSEDDGTIDVGQQVDPGRWWEGNDMGTNIFIHCCDDIEAELEEGCIRQGQFLDLPYLCEVRHRAEEELWIDACYKQ